MYYQIELWKPHFLLLCCENFGVKAFTKSTKENAAYILAFCSTNFGIWALWNWPLEEGFLPKAVPCLCSGTMRDTMGQSAAASKLYPMPIGTIPK